MCKTHWNQYTAGLARDAKARKAAAGGTARADASDPATETAEPAAATEPEPAASRKRRTEPVLVGRGDAG